MKIAVVDIDRTVADPTHRVHLLQGHSEVLGPTGKKGKKHWDLFLDPELMIKDPVMPGAISGLQTLVDLGYDIVFLTGRNRSLWFVTTEWLLQNLRMIVGVNCDLLMRDVDDRRPGAEVKIDILEKYLASSKKISSEVERPMILALDDEPLILDAYARNGILALRAPECWQSLHVLEKE